MKKLYQSISQLLLLTALLLQATGTYAQWSTATLSQARGDLSATSAGGKVFFAGGSTGTDLSKRVDIYDTATNTWSTASLSLARGYYSATSVGGKVFFAGGFVGHPSTGFGNGASNRVDIYNTANNTWSIASLSQARYYLSATSVGHKVFFAGGIDLNTNWSNRVDIYNTANNTWSTASLSQARYDLSATSAGGKVFFAGGSSGTEPFVTKRVDIFNTVTNTWSTASLSQAREGLSATSVGSKVFFAGGSSASGRSNVVDIYDTATNTWSVAKLSQARAHLSATSAGGKAFFAGGYPASGSSNVVDIYDTATNTWSTASLSQARNGLSATTAGGKVFFAGGYSNSGVSNVVDIYDTATIPTAITLGPTPTSQTACVGGTASTTVTATGENPGGAPLTYQWFKNDPDADDPVSGQTTATLSLSGITAAQAGSYYLRVSGDGGVVWSSAFTLRIMALGMSSTNVTCNGGSTGTATVSASGGLASYTYSWSPSGGTGATASGLSAGTYLVTVTDNSGMSCEKSVTITQPTALSITPSQTNVTCFGGINGTASVQVSGGKPGYTYDWSPGSPTGDGTASVSSLVAGNYSVLITDATGCTATQLFTITQPTAFVITPSQTNVTCNGGSNGTASVTVSGGSGSYTYFWYPGTPTGNGTNRVIGLTAGGSVSGVIITDAGTGCSITVPFNITQPAAVLPVITPSGAAASFCVGGSVSLSTTVSFSTYSWKKDGSEVGTGTTYSATTPGIYTVTVTNANGCIGTSAATTVTVNPLPSSLIAAGGPTSFCAGGSVSLSTGSFSSYVWKKDGSPVGTSSTYSATVSGSYTVTVTDTHGCVGTSAATTVAVNALPTVSFTGLNASYCANASAVTLTGSPFSGTGISGSNFNPATAGAGGTITYSYTDGNGCSNTSPPQSVSVPQPVITQAASLSVSSLCAGTELKLTFNVNCPTNASFSAELTDASGTPLGISLGSVNPGSTSLIIPAGTPTGSYKILVKGSNPMLTSLSGLLSVTGLSANYTSTPTVSGPPICAGSSLRVSFTTRTVTCPFPGGTVFTAELSDASGSFASPVSLGVVTAGTNANVPIPQTTPTGTGYRLRIAATAGGSSVYSAYSATFAVNQPSFAAVPTVSGDNKCAGESVRLSFTVGCAFFAENGFTAELSNAAGSFASPVSVGVVTPGALNNVLIPVGTPAGTGYKLRVVSSSPLVTSAVSANFKVKVCGNTLEVSPEDAGIQVRVSPNPSTEGRLRIHVSGAEGQALKVALFNRLGQPVREQALERALEENVLEWDIARQPQGLYLLRVSGAKEAKTVKVVH